MEFLSELGDTIVKIILSLFVLVFIVGITYCLTRGRRPPPTDEEEDPKQLRNGVGIVHRQ